MPRRSMGFRHSARFAIRVAFAAVLPLLPEIILTAAEESAHETRRVRATTGDLRSALEDGVARSPTLRDLVDRLQRSDLIVHISPQRRREQGLDGELQLAVSTTTVRYLRIAVRDDLPVAVLIAMIGHELQHALEIAAAPAVVDAESLAALYRSIGYEHTPHRYETDAAQQIAIRILSEIGGPSIRLR